ncbi:hypothetical protein [Reichenbachiella sp.]|uniref:hypothetical protein n=1 Tax=Reichenbachiella sp. TaxID=2184521 RepID=UPI003B5B3A7C
MRPSLFLAANVMLSIVAIACFMHDVPNWVLVWTFCSGGLNLIVPVDTDKKSDDLEAVLVLLGLFVLSMITLPVLAITAPFNIIYKLGKEASNG